MGVRNSLGNFTIDTIKKCISFFSRDNTIYESVFYVESRGDAEHTHTGRERETVENAILIITTQRGRHERNQSKTVCVRIPSFVQQALRVRVALFETRCVRADNGFLDKTVEINRLQKLHAHAHTENAFFFFSNYSGF